MSEAWNEPHEPAASPSDPHLSSAQQEGASRPESRAFGTASVAGDKAPSATANVRHEIQELYRRGTSELSDQVATQQKMVAKGLLTVSSQLGTMASKSHETGMMNDLAHSASRQIALVGHWLDTSEPSDLTKQVKDFARSKPATFVALGAGLGLLARRVTRSNE